jgi:hypothetical protein
MSLALIVVGYYFVDIDEQTELAGQKYLLLEDPKIALYCSPCAHTLNSTVAPG